MSQKFFCPGCAAANDLVLGSKPNKCSACGMNFALAKFSSAPPVATQPVQVIYQEAPRKQVRAHYVEEEQEYFEDLDKNVLAAAFKVEADRPTRGLKLEDAINNPIAKDNFARQTGPTLTPEEIKQRFKIEAGEKTILSTEDLG